MQRVGWIGLLCCASLAATGAQTTQDAEASFRDSILNKHFILRNFSAETRVRATWTGSELRPELPRWHTLGLLDVKRVQLKGKKLQIDCTRQILVRDTTDQIAAVGDAEPVLIDIAMNGSEPAVVLPQLKEKLFFAGLDEALAAVPKPLQDGIASRLKKAPQEPECDCAAAETPACVDHRPRGGIKPPRVIHETYPKFSSRARNAKLNGDVRVAVMLDASGRIADLWITKPLGLGLDEEAAKSVKRYVFAPATCHDQPYETTIYIDVNFQIY